MSSPDAAKKSDSFRKSGIKNIAISGIVAALSFYSLTLVARKFGGSAGSDAYFFLFSLTTLATGMISSLFATVFLPVFVELKIRAGIAEASEFAGSILTWCILITLPLSIAAYLSYEGFYSFFSKFSHAQIIELKFILIYFAPIFVVSVLSEFFRTLVLALGQYTSAAMGAVFQPVFLILFLFEFSSQLKEESLALSLLLAKLAVLVFMFIVVVKREQLKIPLLLKRNAATSRFVKISAPYWGANLITNFAAFFFDYMATGLGAGVLTSISYAQRIFTLPTTLILNPILEIARTKFSESQARKDFRTFSMHHNKLLQLVLYLTIPIAMMYFFFPEIIISSLFKRGAFGEKGVYIAASCLKVFAFSIPPTCLFMVNGRACESFQRLTWPSIFGTIGNLLLIGTTSIFVERMGYIGIPSARLAMDLLFFLPFGFVALHLFAGKLDLSYFWKVGATALAASLLPIAAYFYFGLNVKLEPSFPSMWLLGAIFCCFAVSYATLVILIDRRIYSCFSDALRR